MSLVKLGCCKNVLKKNKYNSKNRRSKKGRKKGLKLQPNQTRTKKKRKVKYRERPEKRVKKSTAGLAQHAWNWKKTERRNAWGQKKRLKQSVKGFLIQHNSSPRLVSGT